MNATGDLGVAAVPLAQDGDGYGAFGRRFSASGSPSFGEVQLNSYSTGQQRFVEVAMAKGGDFVTTWSSNGQDGNAYGVFARRFNADGTPDSDEIAVNTYTTGSQSLSGIATDKKGNFVVTWTSLGQDGNSDGIFARRFDASGTAIGGEIAVNTYTTGSQYRPSIAATPKGGFVVSWSGVDASSTGVFARRFDASGNAIGGEIQVNTYTTGTQVSPTIATDKKGAFVVTWQGDGSADAGGISVRRFGADGAPIGGEVAVNAYTTGSQTFPGVATDKKGGFVVTWEGGGATDAAGIFARRFDPSGVATSGDISVNNTTTDVQGLAEVAVTKSGFVVTWRSLGIDGSDRGVEARLFDSAGAPIASEFGVNSYTTGSQSFPSIASDKSGNFVIVWQGG